MKYKAYKDILDTSGRMYSKMKVIRSQKHRMYTMEINKDSLSAYDDKRYILNDDIHTLAYGHYRIPTVSRPTNSHIEVPHRVYT